MKTVSVIIPTYNRLNLLAQAIDSVNRQTIEDIEIIVVDDGSDVPVANQLSNSGHIHFIRQQNLGLNAARNLGLKVAQGSFIALLDDDDLWNPTKTEMQLFVLRRFPEVSFVFSDFSIFNHNGIKSDSGLESLYGFPANAVSEWQYTLSAKEIGMPLSTSGQDFRILIGSIYHDLLFDPYVLPSTTLVRRSAIENDDPFPVDNIHCGDWRFFAELTRKAPCAFVQIPTAMNRSHDDAVRLTRKSPIIRMQDRLKLIEDVWRADTVFMETFGHEVDRVEGGLLSRLAILSLLEDRRAEALDYLARRRKLAGTKMGTKDRLLSWVARLPCSPPLLRTLRWMKSYGRV